MPGRCQRKYSINEPSKNPATATTRTTTSTGSSTTLSTTTRTTTGGGSGTGTYPTTLQSGYYWVRAVEAPNFHSYLQAAPTATPSPSPGLAHLLSPKSAGQFNIVDGQLVYYTPGGTLLYMWVENPTDKTQRKLETGFGTEKNTYGTFAFQGDTVTWSVGDIKRPNTAAWLVCGDGGQLYINTGAYAYDTPQGCADETVSFFLSFFWLSCCVIPGANYSCADTLLWGFDSGCMKAFVRD